MGLNVVCEGFGVENAIDIDGLCECAKAMEVTKIDCLATDPSRDRNLILCTKGLIEFCIVTMFMHQMPMRVRKLT